MTKEEALHFLASNASDDLDEIYEQKLFEIKQFLLTRVPLRKLIDSRMAVIDKWLEAMAVLGLEEPESEVSFDESVVNGSIIEVFNDFNEKRNRMKLCISGMNSLTGLMACAELNFTLYMNYARCWKTDVEDTGEEKSSVERDPMDLYREIVRIAEKGIVKFEDILQLPEENILLKEMKRLNLWLKLNCDGGSV